MKITSTEFQQNVGRYQDQALQTPVAITKNGRPHTVLMSAALFEVLVRGRIARPVEDLDDDTLKAIRGSAVAPEHAALDKLLKDLAPRDAPETAAGACDFLFVFVGEGTRGQGPKKAARIGPVPLSPRVRSWKGGKW